MEKAGARIAELIGCEAAIVTSGAAAALSQATAACIVGTDPELMQQLPNLAGLKDEVIMPRESRNVYDHAFRSWGTRVIEVDTVDAFHAALGPRTAMVAVLGTGEARGPLRLEAIVAATRKMGVPVIVDAAAEIPRRPDPYLTRGADLVAYSGGKTMRGPQCAGLLLGRKDLVWAAFMNGAPHHAVGRMMKVGKGRDHGDGRGGRSAHEPRHRRGLPPVEGNGSRKSATPSPRCPASVPRCASPRAPVRFRRWSSSGIQRKWGSRPVRSTICCSKASRASCRMRPAMATRSRFGRRRFGPAIKRWRVAASPRCCGRRRRARRRERWRPRAQTLRDAGRSTSSTAGERLATNCCWSRMGIASTAVISADDSRAPSAGRVDGDRVRLRSSLPCEGTQLTYRFDGRINGHAIDGESGSRRIRQGSLDGACAWVRDRLESASHVRYGRAAQLDFISFSSKGGPHVTHSLVARCRDVLVCRLRIRSTLSVDAGTVEEVHGNRIRTTASRTAGRRCPMRC